MALPIKKCIIYQHKKQTPQIPRGAVSSTHGEERVSNGSATIFISCEDTLGVLTSFKHTDEIY